MAESAFLIGWWHHSRPKLVVYRQVDVFPEGLGESFGLTGFGINNSYCYILCTFVSRPNNHDFITTYMITARYATVILQFI